jgi:mannose-6-phosphate isomerase-like protein (cupin superfamily)
VINARTAEHYVWGEGCDAWRLVAQEGLGVVQERVPPGAGETRHLHRAARQFFFVLSGVATFELAGRTYTLRPHDGIEVPPGAPHRIANESAEDLVFLLVAQPNSRGDRVPA